MSDDVRKGADCLLQCFLCVEGGHDNRDSLAVDHEGNSSCWVVVNPATIGTHGLNAPQ